MAEKKIGDRVYHVAPLLAKRALVLQAKLIKIVGPAMPAIVRAFASQGNDEGARAAAGVEALNAISAGLDPEAFGNLVEEIVELAEVKDGSAYRRVILDQDFTGDLGGIIPVASFVLQEQFGDFFRGLVGNGPRSGPAKASPKPS